MRVADCNCERISLIRARCPTQTQNGFNHMLHLFFICAAPDDDRLFDLPGRILEQLQPAAEGSADGRRTRLPQLQGTVGVPMDEDFLNCHLSRSEFLDNFANPCVDLFEARAKIGGADPNTTAYDIAGVFAIAIHDAVTRNSGARIDTKNSDQLSQSDPPGVN